MSARKPPAPPGPTDIEVDTGGYHNLHQQPEPLNAQEREWRKYVTREMGEREIEAMGRELVGAQALASSQAAGVAAMLASADEVEKTTGPATAAHVRQQAQDLAVKQERTEGRVRHIKEQIAWRRKALKG